jgi:hypothetical protein
MPLGLEYLAKSFYADRFADLDLNTEVHNFFQRFCGVNLTENQVTKILGHEM